MFDTTWNDEVAAHRETEIAEEAFQRGAEDAPASVQDGWIGADAIDVDDGAFIQYRHSRVEEHTDLEAGRVRFVILCDDGQEVEIKALVAKLNKKLVKWGQEITLIAEDEVLTEHWLYGSKVGRAVTDQDRERGLTERFDTSLGRVAKRGTLRQVRLTIESPAVAGKKTKLIGSFEMAEDGIQVYRHALNGATDADIEPFLARWQDCDHCGFNRDRHATFVCEAEDGERVVIGRQCSRDFLGLDAAELLARESIRKALSGGDDEEGGGGWGSHYLHVESVAKVAYIVAKRRGGYSREIRGEFLQDMAALQGARDYGRDTTNADIRREYKEWLEKRPLEPMDFHAFSDFMYEPRHTGDFWDNVRIVFGLEWAKPKRNIYIACGVGMFIGRAVKLAKEVEAEARKALPPAKHLDGEEGKRVDFQGSVERTIPLASDFGPKTRIAIVADDGSRCVHYCTGANLPEPGTRYSIRATIKRHGQNKKFGTPETTLTRAVYGPLDESQPKLI